MPLKYKVIQSVTFQMTKSGRHPLPILYAIRAEQDLTTRTVTAKVTAAVFEASKASRKSLRGETK